MDWGAQLVCVKSVKGTEAESNHGTIYIYSMVTPMWEKGQASLLPFLSIIYLLFYTSVICVKMDIYTHSHNIQAVHHTHKFNTLKTTSHIHAILHVSSRHIKGNTLLSSPSPILEAS